VSAKHGPVTGAVNAVLLFADPSKVGSKLYLKYLNLFNYAIVCGIGVLINMTIITTVFNMTGELMVSNALAILTAFLWNWSFSVGPFGHVFDLKPPPPPTIKEEKPVE
jgi:putative flippase GtrA